MWIESRAMVNPEIGLNGDGGRGESVVRRGGGQNDEVDIAGLNSSPLTRQDRGRGPQI